MDTPVNTTMEDLFNHTSLHSDNFTGFNHDEIFEGELYKAIPKKLSTTVYINPDA